MPEAAPVSVVMPTYRREERLFEALGDVLALEYPELEVLLVDQTPTHLPSTQAFLRSVADRVRVLRRRRPHLVSALNAGIAAARGDIVLFLDDDIRIPDRSLVRHHVRNYDDATIGGVTGRIVDAATGAEGRCDPRAADPVFGFFHTAWDHRTRVRVYTAAGANMSFRRDLLVQLGGFDERFVGNAFRFENDFVLRLHRAGFDVVFDPAAEVLHHYGSPGGADNRHLFGRDPASHAWYVAFFHNHAYCDLKHAPRRWLPRLWWGLYRSHVLNRPYLSEGPRFLGQRHLAFVRGLAGAIRDWAEARRGTPHARGD
jgi:GT2 family glycosyltransferase